MRTWSNLTLRSGARWPKGRDGRRLLRRLNRAARKAGLQLVVVSGQRNWREQHRAYMDYLRGGTLAAPCCSRHYLHSEAMCLRQCGSRHCVGRAADVDAVLQPGGAWTPVGNVAKMRYELRAAGLCLPVPGEPWHVECGSDWRA